jgi:integrase
MRGHIRTRRGPQGVSYQLAVYLGCDEAGRRRYQYETVTGPRREAERRLAELVSEVERGVSGPIRKVSVAELVRTWWEASADDLSANTRIGYRGLLDRYVLPTLGPRRIDRINPLELERWYAQLLDGSGAKSQRPLSPTTVRKLHTLVGGIFSTAVRWGWLRANPIHAVRPPRAVKSTVHPPEPEDVARILGAAETLVQPVDHELYVFLRLSAAIGTRRSETAALHWSDVNLDAGHVLVHRALVLDDTQPTRVLEQGTKTQTAAHLALDAETISVLRDFRAAATQRAIACGVAFEPDSYVFSPEPDGSRPRHPDHFSKAWIRLRQNIGFGHVRLHDFRHFHGTELAAAGIPIPTVRDRLRHSDLRTTSIYTHSGRELDRAAAEAIGRVLPKPRGRDALGR